MLDYEVGRHELSKWRSSDGDAHGCIAHGGKIQPVLEFDPSRARHGDIL